MSSVEVSFQLLKQKLSMFLFPSVVKRQMWRDKLMNIKQKILGFHFYVTLIIKYTKMYYW